MDFLSRINAVLHHEAPDQVPFAPYDNLIPRGEFGRELRNRGMGLCLRCSTVRAHTPHVSVETRTEEDTTVTTYRTPEGLVSTRRRTHRRTHGGAVLVEGMIKHTKDYDAVLFMVEDTVFELDESAYHDRQRDVGVDGIVRDYAIDPQLESVPYGATRRYYGDLYGLDSWVYAQRDHPDHFARLLDALERREEKRIRLAADSPAEFVSFGWLGGLWGPDDVRQRELPFYRKWIPYLQERGKICALHADALTLSHYTGVVSEMGFDVIEAFTPPPVGDLPLAEARQAWGDETIIWVNFPETVFHFGQEETERYTTELIKSGAPAGALVIGFTEMGFWGVADDETNHCFRLGTLAIMDAVEKHGSYPVSPI